MGKTSKGRSPQRFWAFLLVLLVLLGVGFRCLNLDRKVYWVDEVYTSLRMSGFTESEFVESVFTGEEIRAGALQYYQTPTLERTLDDALAALQGNAEHAPLYFLLARIWTQQWGYSVATIRALSVVFSLIALPCLYWLCWELFEVVEVAGLAVGLMAIAPLHVLYAQEARQYSLWTVTILLSSAVLLRAIRRQSVVDWGIYAITVALGLYTHLWFGLVAIAHALYVAIQVQGYRSKTAANYVLASAFGLFAFTPWLLVILRGWGQIQTTTAFLNKAYSLSQIIDFWFLNLNRVFIDQELGSANLLLVVLTLYALYFLWCNTPDRVRWFVLLLVGIPFLVLSLPDVIWGGQRSLRIRYLIPCFLGIQVAIAYLLATQAFHLSRYETWFISRPATLPAPPHAIAKGFWRLVLAFLIIAGIVACTLSSQAQVWWNKSTQKSAYFPPAAAIINQSENPLVISDGDPISLLSFSYLLQPEVRLRLLQNPRQISPSGSWAGAFLLNPSNTLKNRLTRSTNLEAVPIVLEGLEDKPHLWRLSS